MNCVARGRHLIGRRQPPWSVVVPTVGRPSLEPLLACLCRGGPGLVEVVVADDRPGGGGDAPVDVDLSGSVPVRRLRTGGRGPAAARNTGWCAASGEWIVFVDDDVELAATWTVDTAADLSAADPDDVGVQGRIVVPLPPNRRPTDWERQTAGLTSAQWATADMAYRRDVLCRVGGFDERFRRAHREDADLGLRVAGHGRIVQGRRWVTHPVRPAPWHVSIGRQRGNAADVRMWLKHGGGWRDRCQAPKGRRRWHMLTVGSAAVAIAAWATGRTRVAAALGTAWLALNADFALRRIAPGPRDRQEVATMLATSVAIPPAAVAATVAGTARESQQGRRLGRASHRHPMSAAPPVAAVLFDRDGTLVEDVPYNGDPDRIQPVADAGDVLARLRAAAIGIGLVTNQSAVAHGLISEADVTACHRRLQDLVGPFDAVAACLHRAEDGCDCRKPAPGLIRQASDQLGVAPAACVVVGDIGADLAAAAAAGARSVLVPNSSTRSQEVLGARYVARSLTEAVDMILTGLV